MNSNMILKKMNVPKFAAGAVALAALLIAGCSADTVKEPDAFDVVDPVLRRVAEARLSPTEGNETEGVVTFIEEREGIRVIADIRNLSVSGRHGFHIHENGDCSAPDGSSAGGHFNPTGEVHASPMVDKRHVGDLGNLEATEAGGAMYVRVDEHIRFDGESSIIGRAVIVHAKPDDYTSQPTGAAGARIACGVIEWVEQGSGR